MDWQGYERRLRRAASTHTEHVWMVTHGWRPQDEQRDRWSAAAEREIGNNVQTEYCAVPPCQEDEFAQGWQGQEGSLVVVFNAASTPEDEEQGQLVKDLRSRFGHGRVTALLDTESLRARRAQDSVESRLALWRTVLKNHVDDVWTTHA
jgi:hypothetical protein